MPEGLQGLAFEVSDFVAVQSDGGFSGLGFELGDGIAIRIGIGFLGMAFEKPLKNLVSLTFTDLLGIATNHRLDDLKVTIPDGRIFNLGSDIPYGTIPVPYCFYDDMYTGQVKVSGYKRCYWPSAGIAEEYFEYFI